MQTVKTARSYTFIYLGTIPEHDGRTDRQNSSGYYSALHCEQCGRSVIKNVHGNNVYKEKTPTVKTSKRNKVHTKAVKWPR